MRVAAALVMMLALTGCWCAPDKGDVTAGDGISAYTSSCWNYAKNNKEKSVRQ